MHYTSNHPKSIFKAIVQSQNILPDMHYISDHLKSIFKAIVQSQNILPDIYCTSNHPKSVSKPLFKARIDYQTCITLPTIQRAFSKPLCTPTRPVLSYQISLSSSQNSSSHSILTILLQANG